MTNSTAATQKPSIPLFLAGLGIAGAAVWAAWDGAVNGVLDIHTRGLKLHVVLAEDPVGFWLAEAGLGLLALAFFLAALAMLRPRTGAR
ncbi:hypothetical protein [Devosia sp.]|jgi:hypothetical protein|uniref:hypothetical protein n=1 Tax=Devosia sp. TaxID=1871048 RepID=UPI0037C12B37